MSVGENNFSQSFLVVGSHPQAVEHFFFREKAFPLPTLHQGLNLRFPSRAGNYFAQEVVVRHETFLFLEPSSK